MCDFLASPVSRQNTRCWSFHCSPPLTIIVLVNYYQSESQLGVIQCFILSILGTGIECEWFQGGSETPAKKDLNLTSDSVHQQLLNEQPCLPPWPRNTRTAPAWAVLQRAPTAPTSPSSTVPICRPSPVWRWVKNTFLVFYKTSSLSLLRPVRRTCDNALHNRWMVVF